MNDILSNFFVTGPFIPHGHCYLWQPRLVWLHLISDSLIALAYYSIPLTLFYFVRKRQDLPFANVFVLFATFIVACGTTHLLEIWTLWYPTYWFSGTVKALTAMVSLLTASVLVPLVPQALALPSPAQLEQANQALHTQIHQRLEIETALRQAQNQLEQRVQERTAALVHANEQLQHEISDRETIEAELRQREGRFSTLFNGMEDWVLVYHLTADNQPGPLIEVNEQACQRLGYTRQELLSKSVLDLIELQQDTLHSRLDQLRVENHLVVGSVHRTKADQRVPVEVSATLFTLNGLPTVQAICRDITERKQTEAAIASLNRDLQNRVDDLQTLFEVIPVGIAMSDDLEFQQIRVNPEFARILGIVPASDASLTLPEIGTNPTYKILQNGRELAPDETPLRYAGLQGVALKGVEVDILRGDGILINLYGYASPLRDEQGQPRGSLGAFLDITDRKRTEAEREQLLERERIAREQAEAANRIKDEFLAVLSHELRTPLNPILGWIQLLRKGTLDHSTATIALETIERNAKLQTQLIEDLLDISRILQGKLALKLDAVDLAAIIEAAKETIRLAAESKSITLHTAVESTPRSLLGDANRLQQVMWNLLSNAVKFTPPEGQVYVALTYTPTEAQITVRDTGQGINPDFLPYVFDTFRQADGTITRKFGGLGLGLAIVRQIVQLHGGTVVAESQGEGQGATFSVRLPLRTTRLPASQSREQAVQPLSLQAFHILVVEDEPDTRELLTFVLEQAGARVTAVASAAAALASLLESIPDILLSDIGMAEMNGYSLMRQIRSLNPDQGGQIPAIALTAYVGEYDQQQALEAGFQQHLSKPVEPETLVRTIAQLVQPK